MKKTGIYILALLVCANISEAQQAVKRKIEPCPCQVKIDSSFKTECAYLVVPENRYKNNGRTIKVPFIIVKSNNPNKKKDPVLFTTGGPGGSSLGWAAGAANRTFINDRDAIAFEQRGTRYAIPNLWSNELDDAIKTSYRKNLNKDSMVIAGAKRYKAALEVKGIDLSGYNTDETVADIHDLLFTLGIDSVNLTGGSYSGGLMLAVLQKDPSKIRSLVLDSPLPTFVPIDEDEPSNFNEALHILFQQVEKDSADKNIYANLEARFKQYFTTLAGKTFYQSYLEKEGSDSLHVAYTRNDLFDIIQNNFYRRSDLAYIITEIVKGHHSIFMKDRLDQIFHGGNGPSGMRISVYCADQAAYHSETILYQGYDLYPYMSGYHINDVYNGICDCWQVSAIKKQTKQPFYSGKPALLADGAMDNACRPLYIDMIHHYMPNSQRLLYTKGAHMVIGGKDWDAIVRGFLDDPFKKIETDKKDIVVY